MARAKRKRTVAIEQGIWRCIVPRSARAEAAGYGRHFESSGVFFNAGEAFQHEKAIGRDTQARMMMKATPIAPFVMPKPGSCEESIAGLASRQAREIANLGFADRSPFPRQGE